MVSKKKAKAKRSRIKAILLLIGGILIVTSLMTYIIANEAYYNSDKKKWFTIYKDIASTERSLKEGDQDSWSGTLHCELPHTPFRTEPSSCTSEIFKSFFTTDAATVKTKVNSFYKQIEKTGLWELQDNNKEDYPYLNEQPSNEFDFSKGGSRIYRNKATGFDCYAFSELTEKNYTRLKLTLTCNGQALKPWYDIQYQRSLKKFLGE